MQGMGLAELIQSLGTLMAGVPKPIPQGMCSFCRKKVEPLYEGPNGVFICAECAKLSIKTLDAEYRGEERHHRFMTLLNSSLNELAGAIFRTAFRFSGQL